MQYIQTLLLLLSTTFFISCGENTTNAPIPDVVSISLDNTNNISIYSTQIKPLTATISYTDGTTADVTDQLVWSSSDSTIFEATVGSVRASKNGGDANLTVSYADTFYDTTTVHVKELLSIQYSDVNVSDIGTAQTIYVSGTFENNETNVSMETGIEWEINGTATIAESNASSITLTLQDTQSLLYGTHFETKFCHPLTKKLLSINYSDFNTSDTDSNQTIFISGNYENNESNASIEHTLVWSTDNNSTIIDSNSTQIKIKLINLPTQITATMFSGTLCSINFFKTIK